jgi:hypothetical protein
MSMGHNFFEKIRGLVRSGLALVLDTGDTWNITGNVSVSGTLAAGATTPSSVAATGAVASSSPTAGIGYATGAGGAVTQITNRSTGVTLSKITGAITTDTTSLAAEGSAEFTVTNTAVAVGDTVIVCERSGSNSGGTIVFCSGVAAGSFNITVHNGNVAAGTAETGAIIINFAVIKAVSA